MRTDNLGCTDGFVSLKGVRKDFVTGDGQFTALKGIDLSIRKGEYIAVVGRSGSGKTTLLNVVTGIDRPTSGEVAVGGMTLSSLKEDRLASWRGRNVGIVFQFFQLLPTLSILENVMLPMDFLGAVPAGKRKGRAEYLLERTGILDQKGKLPHALSGGQQQRAALARSLANDPALIVADEPTGNLDSGTADSIYALFKELSLEGKTIILVTHERSNDNFAGRVVTLADGAVISDKVREAEGVPV